MPLGAARATILSAGGGAAGLEEVSSTAADHAAALDPWDDTVTVPSGSGRIILDFVAPQETDITGMTDNIDPAGVNTPLTELDGGRVSGGNECCVVYRLLEANMPAVGARTLRCNLPSSEPGARQTVVLRGASQTLFSAEAQHDANTALTVTVNHPTGNFAAGSLVYAAMMAETNTAYTVTGSVTEVRDVETGEAVIDRFVFAAGTLASPQASASATFTRAVVGTVRKIAVIVVVEPAA